MGRRRLGPLSSRRPGADLNEAIELHAGQAEGTADKFKQLKPAEKDGDSGVLENASRTEIDG